MSLENIKNFQFYELPYILSIRSIQKKSKMNSKIKNLITQLSFFKYSKFRNSEISVVLNWVLPNIDAHIQIKYPSLLKKVSKIHKLIIKNTILSKNLSHKSFLNFHIFEFFSLKQQNEIFQFSN